MRFIISAIIILVLDQSSKSFLLDFLEKPWWIIQDHVGFELSYNTGVAFSLPITGMWSIVLPILVMCFLLYYYYRHLQKSPVLDVAMGIIIGGAIGNLIDRFQHGAVVDFIKVFSWPSFNIADSAITIGVILILVLVSKQSQQK